MSRPPLFGPRDPRMPKVPDASNRESVIPEGWVPVHCGNCGVRLAVTLVGMPDPVCMKCWWASKQGSEP